MQITVAQYCEHTGFSLQRVGSMLRRGVKPPGIIDFEKFGQTYVMEALKNWKEIAKPLDRYQHIPKITPADEQAKF